MRPLCAGLLMLLGVVACDRSRNAQPGQVASSTVSPGSPAQVFDESSSIAVVGPNRTQLENAPHVALTKLFEVGAADDPAHEEFEDITGMAVTDAGVTLAVDRMARHIKAFSRKGMLVNTIGRQGEGPGEFLAPEMVVASRDTLYVLDITRGGLVINRFKADGTYIDRRTLPAENDGVRGITSMARVPSGLVVSFAPGVRHEATSPFRDTIALYPLDPATGKFGNPIIRIASEDKYDMHRMLFLSIETDPITYFAVAGDGTLYVDGHDGHSVYRVPLEDQTAETRFNLQTEPRKVDSSVRANTVKYLRTALNAKASAFQPGKIDELLDLVKKAPQGKFYAVAGRIIASDSGAVLIRRTDFGEAAQREGTTPSVWELFNRDGALVGRIDFPAQFKPQVLKGDMIVGIRKDSMDVQSVVAYSMAHPN